MVTSSAKLKRSHFHDYHMPSIYLVTVTVADRNSVLSSVEGSVEQPKVKLTEVGKAVKQEIFAIEKRYPQVKVLFNIIMPDHAHLILHVKEQLPEKKSLGNVVAAWKQACGKAYSALLAKQIIGGSCGRPLALTDKAFRPAKRALARLKTSYKHNHQPTSHSFPPASTIAFSPAATNSRE